ncbi:hypothetical protein PMIN02_011039 [Paraphaeosphaeria minitans]
MSAVDELDVLVLVEQDVLELEIAVDARLVVHVRDGADELGEDLLDLGGAERAVGEEVVVEFVACSGKSDVFLPTDMEARRARTRAVLEGQPDERLGDDDLVQAGNVGVDELAVVVDLAGEGQRWEQAVCTRATDLGAVGELVGGQIDLAKAALANQPAQGVVAHVLEVWGGEFTGGASACVKEEEEEGEEGEGGCGVLEELLVRVCELLRRVSRQTGREERDETEVAGAPSSSLQPERECSTASGGAAAGSEGRRSVIYMSTPANTATYEGVQRA